MYVCLVVMCNIDCHCSKHAKSLSAALPFRLVSMVSLGVAYTVT